MTIPPRITQRADVSERRPSRSPTAKPTIPATTGSNWRITAARLGSTKRWPQSWRRERDRAARDPGDEDRDDDLAVMWPKPPIRDDGDREHREHDELPGGERDRVEARREDAAEEDPHANMNAQPSVERVARAAAGACRPRARTGRTTDTADREHDVARRALRRVTTVSISGVNTTNNPVMNAEFDVVVRSSPRFCNQYPANADAAEREHGTHEVSDACSRTAPGRRQPRRSANGMSTIAPIPNRSRMKPTGVTSSSAFCTSLNVAPYATVAAINASSGRSGRGVSHACEASTPGRGHGQPGQRLVIGQAAVLAERLGRHAHARRRLAALVLVAVDHPRDASARARRRARARSARATERSPST